MYEVCKRIFDIVCALFGILLLSPVLILVAILIRLDSPGPVFYRGIRTGRYGKPFKIMKFRSMVTDAERGAGATAKNDARITRIGKFIRRYKIDELPQLINVLVGEMSFVGPRPELTRLTDLYVGEEKEILDACPGITDFASLYLIQQSELLDCDDPEKVFLEKIHPLKTCLRLKYVRERSFKIDLWLIYLTMMKILKRDWHMTEIDIPVNT